MTDIKIGKAVLGAPSMGVSESQPTSPNRGMWCIKCGATDEAVMTRCKNDPASNEYQLRSSKGEDCEWLPVEGGA